MKQCCAQSSELMWVKCSWEAGFDVLLNQPFKALHNNRGMCNRAVVVKSTDDCFLRLWNNCYWLQAGWCGACWQGQVEDLCEDCKKLICTFFEHPSRHYIWACSLPWVNSPKRTPNPVLLYCEWGWLSIGGRCWWCDRLCRFHFKAGKEVVKFFCQRDISM